VTERVRRTGELLRAHHLLPLTGRRILDVGSGYGAELARMTAFGAEPELLTGIDLIEERVKQAKLAFPTLRFEVGNADQLPFPDGAFDLLMAFTLFSSILDEGMTSRVASEMSRTLKAGGAILWYDLRFRSPNQAVRPISPATLARLFPDRQATLVTLTVLPPIARRLWRLTPILYPMLAGLEALRSHYLGILR